VARVTEVEEDLKGLCTQHDALHKDKDKLSELVIANSACKEATTQARADRGVLQQVKQIAAGKPYLLRCIFW
jgi:hypothetical protein